MEAVYQAIETVELIERHPPAPGMDQVVKQLRKELLHLFDSYQIDPTTYAVLDDKLSKSRHMAASTDPSPPAA